MKGQAGSRPAVSCTLALACVVVGATLALAACGGSATNALDSSTPSPTYSPPIVTSRPATPLPAPTVAGTIAFAQVRRALLEVAGREPNSDICVINTDGSGLKRLTNAPCWEDHPTWSPDGRRIAYCQWRTSDVKTTNIWVMNADGSGKTLLTKGAVGGNSPAWSADGRRILFAGPTRGVYVMNADGSGLKTVDSAPGLTDAPDSSSGGGLAWAPDGRILTLRSGDVVAMATDGGSKVKLTDGAGLGTFAISPDGTKIVLADTNSGLQIAPVQGGAAPVMFTRALTFLIADPYPAASWSPDGAAMVMTSSSISGYAYGSPLYVTNADGSGLSVIPGVTKALDAAWRPR
jgi:hypothetical protein